MRISATSLGVLLDAAEGVECCYKLEKPQKSERFREAVNVLAGQKKIPVYQFRIRKEKTRSPTNSAVDGGCGTRSSSSEWHKGKPRRFTEERRRAVSVRPE